MPPALHDPTTDLPTRELLREHARLALARAVQDGREVALIHVGLDGFGLVNSSLGHDAGDAILREAGARVRAAVPDRHVVARAGGDELCVLLADLPPGSLDAIDEIGGAVLAALREPYEGAGSTFELGASAGASIFPADAPDDEALLRHADAALREAKDAHRGSLVFYAGATSEALHRLLITSRLRNALESQEFFLEFQPIVGLPGGEVAAVEALLRWQDPQRGRIAPLEFIPHAEESGLIVGIGAWVLDTACAQAAAFRDAGFDIGVSFNVSPRQFCDPGFTETLRERIAARGVEPDRLIVEVTESTAMHDETEAGPIFHALRDIGVRIAIDDFGAGHSSLGRLRDLPVDLLKLDGTFLTRTPEDARAKRLVVATLALADALGMRAIVEGVETAAQYDFLLAEHAELLQGFHLARPMAPDHVMELLRA